MSEFNPTTPRCGMPVRWSNLNRPRDEYMDYGELCWRPAGHAPNGHRSREAYTLQRNKYNAKRRVKK